MDGSGSRAGADAASVKHGCALEGGKMLNCVGIFREKQQKWLDWLTISLWWDTIRRKPVSVSRSGRRIELLRFWIVVQAVTHSLTHSLPVLMPLALR